MLKRTAPIVVFLVAFSLTAFAHSVTAHGTRSSDGASDFRATLSQAGFVAGLGNADLGRFLQDALSDNDKQTRRELREERRERKEERRERKAAKVPEPASLLALGTGLLLGFGIVRRQLRG